MTHPGEGKKLTVCLYLTGDRSRESLALINSMLTMPGVSTVWELLIAIDSPAYDIKHVIQREYQFIQKAVFFESGSALGKITWWRIMMANVRSDYALLIDGSTDLSPNWFSVITNFIRDNSETTLAGFKNTQLASPDNSNWRFSLKSGPILVKTSWYRASEHTPLESLNASKGEIQFFDFSMAATLGVSPDTLGSFDVAVLLSHGKETSSEQSPNTDRPLLTICLCSYGNHPELIMRCLDSILLDSIERKEIEIILGCNQVAAEVMREIDRRYNDGFITSIVRSPSNFNKAGMQRFMFRMAQSPYVLSIDDDIYFKPGWSRAMREFVTSSQPFDVAGRLHSLSNRALWSGQKKPYDTYCVKKKWWRGKKPYGAEVIFPAGQCFVVRTKFALDNDYPDLDMRIDWDDVLLGDMVTQLDGRQIGFSDAALRSLVVDDTPSRGQHGAG